MKDELNREGLPSAPAATEDPLEPWEAAYEAYVLAAPGDIFLPEPDRLADWEPAAWAAAVQAGVEASPNAPKRLADGNRRLRAENDRLRGQIQAARLLAEQGAASGFVDCQDILSQLGDA